MDYNAELLFLKNVLSKTHIASTTFSVNTKIQYALNGGLSSLFIARENLQKSIKELFPDIKSNVIYRITNHFHCRYIFFLLPPENSELLVIGPYTLKEITRKDILEKAEKLSFGVDSAKKLEYFYQTVPYLTNEGNIFALINSFAERIWGNNLFQLEDVDNESAAFSPTSPGYDEEAPLLNMRMMEERYQHEQELMDAISHGQTHKAEILRLSFSKLSFESRIADPLRNMKNYCIITNTLFRKAAQNGGVHPIYLDSISSDYAKKLEQLTSASAASELILDMFTSYCNLVRKHSTENYSPLIQKVIILIDSDLTAPLSLADIAEKNNISSGYLSAAFKKETGMTLTDFVSKRRIKYAKKLLKTTNLQIQTVAQHCGILDVHYFTKLFKKYEGITPKQYREK